LLERLITSSPHPLIRAYALEATAFERAVFDWDLVMPFLSPDCHIEEIVSALYASEFQSIASTHEVLARERIAPLLSHPSPRVRAHAVQALAESPANWSIISALQDDPDETVKESIRWALQRHDY